MSQIKQPIKCPVCGEVAKEDTKNLPQREGKKLRVHFICPNGHEFVKEITLK